MKRLGLPIDSLGVTPPSPQTIGRLRLLVPAQIVDINTNETLTSQELVRSVDGARAVSADTVIDVVRTETGGSFIASEPEYGWAHASDVVLSFDDKTSTLSAEFSLFLSREPSKVELQTFLRFFREEFLDGDWMSNCDWDREPARDDATIFLESELSAHQIELA
jgi:hypothetical protein